MKITALSDFHGMLPTLKEETDLLLIAGDISPFSIQGNKTEMWEWLETSFRKWIEEVPAFRVILIAGNHDFIFESSSKKKIYDWEQSFDGKLVYLENEYYELGREGEESIKIFGTPYCHIFGNWPYMRSPKVLKEKFLSIPEELDILITHDPVFSLGSSDVILKPKYQSQAHYNHVGNPELYERLIEMEGKAPKYVICGHIHSGEHQLEDHLGMKVANVALMDEYCDRLAYEPLIFEI